MFYFKQNIPVWERILRLCISIMITLSASYFISVVALKVILFLAVTILASTAVIGFCPAYATFGRKTMGQ